MTLTIKKSNSTSKDIVVSNGRIKFGEIINGKFVQTYQATKSVQAIIDRFVSKNSLAK
jgi:hypothetical protein